jgi:hypothetical protein
MDGEDQLDRSCEKSISINTAKQETDILHAVNGSKANCIGHILGWNCIVNLVNEGNLKGRVEVRGGRRSKQLLDDLKEKRGYCGEIASTQHNE